MGASGWDYVAPYQKDAAQALVDLQRELIANGEYYHGQSPDELSPEEREQGGWGSYYQFESLDALLAAKETDEFWEQGTHSILDMDRIVDSGRPDEAGAIAVLSDEETVRLLGSGRPTRSDFERARMDLLRNADFPSSSGRCVVLYDDGRPDGIAFWGYSGD